MKKKSLFSSLLSFLISGIIYSAHGAVFTVTTTAATGAGSIDAAVTAANGNGIGKDTIYFNIPGAGPHTITMGITLQAITGNLLIDGTSQPGYTTLNPIPVIEFVNTVNTTFSVNAGSTEIRALALNGNGGNAHGLILSSSGNKITGCYFGLGLDGTTDKGNRFQGIQINASSNNIIGGPTRAERNIISGNGEHGIQVISGSNNYIIGNYIGTNAAGTAAVLNTFCGIRMEGTSNSNTIGGAASDSSNLISGNGQNSVNISTGNLNRVLGNIMGLQIDKTAPLPNGSGIYLNTCTNTQIGGTGPLAGNIISNNNGIGLNIDFSTNTIIRSNIFGTSGNTQIVRSNNANNIQLYNSPYTVIGGDRTTEGNVISASPGAAINFEGDGSKRTIIKGNYIGTDNTGTLALGNRIGIILKSDTCTIGGTSNGEANIIVDCKVDCGILIADANATVVKGNYIGVGADAVTALGNQTDGINISEENSGQGASSNIVQNNIIAYNRGHGISVGRALNNFNSTNERNNNLRFNSIYCNQQLGISLTLTAPATQGNNGKTAPAINNALSTSNKVVGLANGLLPTDSVDIYEMSECINCDVNPQGKRYITTVYPDASGNWSYDNGSPITGTIIAMATDVLGNSSQFSLCFTPCNAIAQASPTEYSAMLEMGTTVPVTLTSSSIFSNLSPEPGKIYWSMGVADTTAPALLSKASSITLNFEPGGSATTYKPGAYDVYLIAVQSGCKDTALVKLNLFFIPNMITPNGDLRNDNWEVTNAPGQFDARIYNRWGDLVYSKSDYTNEWSGSGLGDGVYYYLLEDKIQSGKSYKGWVQIIK